MNYRETPNGIEFDCPECGGNIEIGWKLATFWTCPRCKALAQVPPWPDDDAPTGEGAPK